MTAAASTHTRLLRRWPWPLPAFAAWATAWFAWWTLAAFGLPLTWALAAGLASGTGLALACQGWWRRAIAAAGFPLSSWALGAAGAWPAWAWLLLLLPLLLAYPMRAWRDAPFFPTPPSALQGLDTIVGHQTRILDAGCGLGHGLHALRQLWPRAELQGVEWSPLLAWLARCRCPWARIRRADMWTQSWAGLDLVYVFQRPESMARVWTKARAEMVTGAWLVSLEFAVPGQLPWASLQPLGQRPLWIYRPGRSKPDSTAASGGR